MVDKLEVFLTIHYFYFRIVEMQNVVSITSQGQLTIPMSVRKHFGIVGASKAIISIIDGIIVVKPKRDFWSLESSMSSEIKLSDKQLKEARKMFGKNWGTNA